MLAVLPVLPWVMDAVAAAPYCVMVAVLPLLVWTISALSPPAPVWRMLAVLLATAVPGTQTLPFQVAPWPMRATWPLPLCTIGLRAVPAWFSSPGTLDETWYRSITPLVAPLALMLTLLPPLPPMVTVFSAAAWAAHRARARQGIRAGRTLEIMVCLHREKGGGIQSRGIHPRASSGKRGV